MRFRTGIFLHILAITALLLISVPSVHAQAYDWSSPSTIFYEHPEVIQRVISVYGFQTNYNAYTYSEVFAEWDPNLGFTSGKICEIAQPSQGVYRHPLEKELSFIQIGSFRVIEAPNYELIDQSSYQLEGAEVRVFKYQRTDLPGEYKEQEGFIELVRDSGEYFGWRVMESCIKTFGETTPQVEDVLKTFLKTIQGDGYLGPEQLSVKLDYMYFERAYGLNLQDGDKAWTQDELRMMDEVLSVLPRKLVDNLSVRTLRRYASAWDANWKSQDNIMGKYYYSSIRDRPGELMIFDSALTQPIYSDPTGRIAFKSTLMHELIHSWEESDPGGKAYENPYDNIYIDSFLTAVMPRVADMSKCGWKWKAGSKRYVFDPCGTTGDLPPYRPGENTNYLPYAQTNPLEDIAVSAEMYMYFPDLLKEQSPRRYDYVRFYIFEGVEYENGIPKP